MNSNLDTVHCFSTSITKGCPPSSFGLALPLLFNSSSSIGEIVDSRSAIQIHLGWSSEVVVDVALSRFEVFRRRRSSFWLRLRLYYSAERSEVDEDDEQDS